MLCMGKLTTHVLDTASGIPAAGVDIRLYALDGGRELKASAVTNTIPRTRTISVLIRRRNTTN